MDRNKSLAELVTEDIEKDMNRNKDMDMTGEKVRNAGVQGLNVLIVQ